MVILQILWKEIINIIGIEAIHIIANKNLDLNPSLLFVDKINKQNIKN